MTEIEKSVHKPSVFMNWKEFLQSNKFTWILITLNLINAVFSTFVFLVFLGVPVYYWFFLNICAPTQFLTIIALLMRNKVLMNIATPLLLYFGFGGLFIFSWSGYMLQAQLNHILMTITAVYIFLLSLSDKQKLITGISIGVVIILILQIFFFPIIFSIPEVKNLFEQMT